MTPDGPSPYEPPAAVLQEPPDTRVARHRAMPRWVYPATYGTIGSVVALPLSAMGASLISETVPLLGGALFWCFAAGASTILPGQVLQRLRHPLARIGLAPVLVGLVAGLTGLWGSLVAAIHAVATGHTDVAFGGGPTAVLGLSLLMAVYVSPLGLPIQAVVELGAWAWDRHTRRKTSFAESDPTDGS